MLTFGKRLLLFVLLYVAGIAITAVLSALIAKLVSDPAAAMRMSAVMQDLFAFILPAIATALLITRLPADFLQIRKPGPRGGLYMILAIAVVVAAIPLINTLVEWNASLSFGALTPMFEKAEETAAQATALMLGNGTMADLILGLLTVGVLAGLSEELFFRGALQRLLMTRPMNPHAAIWITAVVFSAFHMQVFGFVPRMLLGALFGYMTFWSRSVWPAVAAHIFNNSLAVTIYWLEARGTLPAGSDEFGAGSPIWLPVSVVLTAVIMAVAARGRVNRTACDGR